MDASPCAPRPALVILLDPDAADAPAAPDAALLDALPAAAAVLQIGDGDALRDAYLRRHPAASWTRLDPARFEEAAPAGFDLVVLSADAGGWADPSALLARLTRLASPSATLVACAENAASWETLVRLAEADLGQPPSGSGRPGSPRPGAPPRFSGAGLGKLLLDAGWMPDLVATRPTEAPPAALSAAIDALADACSVPRATAARSASVRDFVLRCRRLDDASAEDTHAPQARAASFAVVVPTTRETQFRMNVEASPGLAETGARIVSCRRASSPADALARALPHVDADWVLLAHQDVYFPSGFGRRLAALLAAVPAEDRATTLIGFAGMAVDPGGSAILPAGFVIDRLRRFDHPASTRAVSIDELAIVVARDTRLRIDPDLGWHLWATDLCLSSMLEHRRFARIVRLPLFHNSSNDWSLPESFAESARRLAAKRAGYGPIQTLCGTIDASAPEESHA